MRCSFTAGRMKLISRAFGRRLGSSLIIQAFSIRTEADVRRAEESIADLMIRWIPRAVERGSMFDWDTARDRCSVHIFWQAG